MGIVQTVLIYCFKELGMLKLPRPKTILSLFVVEVVNTTKAYSYVQRDAK